MAYVPKWKQYEKGLFSSDLETAAKASEAFTKTKELELKTSAVARSWEEGKRKVMAAEKPKWAKAKRDAEPAPLRRLAAEVKRGGEFNTGLLPMPGFVLVKPDLKEQTESGILLPDSVDVGSLVNTGVVMAVGGRMKTMHEAIDPPVKPGDKVMIKKGLPGMEMTIKGEFCLFMQWTDILGVFNES